MKRVLIAAILFLAALPSAHADGERIISFLSDITVHEDATLTVREAIRVRAEGEQIRHGIYRDFPTLYQGKYGTRIAVAFQILEVLRDGKREGYHTEGLGNGIRLYIGQKEVLLEPGEYTYTLTYRTDRQLGFFDDHDELYWNVTGNGWIFPINRAEATVRLPTGIPRDRITTDGYTGPEGAQGKAFRALVRSDRTARFETTEPLSPQEGMTIVTGWPKGFVAAPTQKEKIQYLLRDNRAGLIGLAGLLLVLFYYLFIWVLVGRDPVPGTIIPLFEAPDRLSPAAVRYIYKMGYDHKAFAAALIDMAVKKQVRIEEESHYTLHRLDGEGEPLTADEAKVHHQLLDSRKSLDLVSSNHATVAAAIQALKRSLRNAYEKTYFVTNSGYFISAVALTFAVLIVSVSALPGPAKITATFISIWLSGWSVAVFFLLRQVRDRWREFSNGRGLLSRGASLFGALFMTAFAVPFVVGEIAGIVVFMTQASVWLGGILLGLVILNLLFHHLLKAPTRAGRKVLDRIEGFKMYLGVAEKDRLNALTPPKKTPEVFEKFLPYALALDVEQEWSEQFAEVLAQSSREGTSYSPIWYTGAFAAGSFASMIGSSLSGAIASSSTAPGSSSGGGGGGSSGGGGGGGGGGGW